MIIQDIDAPHHDISHQEEMSFCSPHRHYKAPHPHDPHDPHHYDPHCLHHHEPQHDIIHHDPHHPHQYDHHYLHQHDPHHPPPHGHDHRHEAEVSRDLIRALPA